MVILAFVASSVIVLLLIIYPVEDLFVSFSSPQEVFKYTSRGTVEHIINGRESSMVFGRRPKRNLEYHVLPKAESGWKIGSIRDLSICHMQIVSKDITITIERFRDSDDYYVTILDASNDDKTIIDKNGTVFYKGLYDNDQGVRLHHAYVPDYSYDNYIVIDGEIVRMEIDD